MYDEDRQALCQRLSDALEEVTEGLSPLEKALVILDVCKAATGDDKWELGQDAGHGFFFIAQRP